MSRIVLSRVKLSASEKLPLYPEMYACGGSRHHQCPICLLPSEKNPPAEDPFPVNYCCYTLCELLTRDLFAIAKFLIYITFRAELYELCL